LDTALAAAFFTGSPLDDLIFSTFAGAFAAAALAGAAAFFAAPVGADAVFLAAGADFAGLSVAFSAEVMVFFEAEVVVFFELTGLFGN